ncbi:hypothetical protein HQQ80_17875 [Microbacteriaceae bacterium VKM Ac-2855]|nr:hypothetical protein [Microbacteriaceae bacterium VKM Ac-2855]
MVIIVIFGAVVLTGATASTSPVFYVGTALLAALVGGLFLAELFYGREIRAIRSLRIQDPTATVLLARNDDGLAGPFTEAIAGANGGPRVGWSYLASFGQGALEIWSFGSEPGLVASIPTSDIVAIDTTPHHLQHLSVLAIDVTVATERGASRLIMVPANQRLLGLFPLAGSSVALLSKELQRRLE